MSTLKQLVLSPIRFYPSLTFGSSTVFQNPDNRVSHGYNWDGVNSMPYALPIPKQWPDGQPGIEFVINGDAVFYADLYDSDDVLYKSLFVLAHKTVGSDVQYRVFLDGVSGSGIADGYYTIKLFLTSDDSLLLQSEPLLIAPWFDDMVPFEYWNFENDFGVVTDNGTVKYTGRIMLPIKIYDPSSEFEKDVYKDDPGTLTTLRSTIQRVFNFDSMPVPVHVDELFSMAFANSELYLDRMKVNSEEAPEGELIDGSNLKQITGSATLVDFNEEYTREKVETTLTDQVKEWNFNSYTGGSFIGDTFTVNQTVSVQSVVQSEGVVCSEDDMLLVKVVLTENGSSDFPYCALNSAAEEIRFKEWGTNWMFYRMSEDGTVNFEIRNYPGDEARFEAVLTIYKIT